MNVVVAVPAQSVAHGEPRHAGPAAGRQDVHALQIVADDHVPLLVGEDAVAGLDGQGAVPYAVLAVIPAGIVLASPVAGEGIVLAFPDMVAAVEPGSDALVGFAWTPVEVERFEQVVAACDEVLVGVLVVPSLAEQVLHQSRRIRATADLRNHAIHRPADRHHSWSTVSTDRRRGSVVPVRFSVVVR